MVTAEEYPRLSHDLESQENEGRRYLEMIREFVGFRDCFVLMVCTQVSRFTADSYFLHSTQQYIAIQVYWCEHILVDSANGNGLQHSGAH